MVNYFQTYRISPNMPQSGMSKLTNVIGGALVNQVMIKDPYYETMKQALIQQAA